MGNKKILKSSLIIATTAATTFAVLPKVPANAAEVAEKKPTISYRTHVQNIGWQAPVGNGEVAGTSGQSLRVEALKIDFDGPKDVKLTYNVHVQNEGWTGYIEQGKIAGSVGKSQRVEAIKIKAEGLEEKGYVVKYRAHVQNIGWQDWVTANKNEYAGTEGRSLRIEAIQIKVEKITDLLKAKDAALEELNKFVTPEDYTINSEALENAIKAGKDAINKATTEADVQKALEDAKAAIDEIMSDDDVEAVGTAVGQFETYTENEALKRIVPGSEMRYVETPDIQSAIANGYSLINSAKNAEEAQANLATAENDVLTATKEYVKSLLNTIYNNGEAYYDMVLTEAKYQAYSNGIEEATTVEDAINAYETAERERYSLSEKINEVVEELTNYIENSALKKTVPGSTIDFAAVPDINEKIAEGYSLINSAKNSEEAETALNTVKDNILNATKAYTQFLLDEIYNEGFGYEFGEEDDRLILIKEKYDQRTNEITAAETVEDAIAAYENALNDRMVVSDYDLYSAKETAKNNLSTYKGGAEKFTLNKDAYDAAISEATQEIESAESIDDVIAKLEEAKTKINAIKNDEEEKEATDDKISYAVKSLTKYVEETATSLKRTVPGSEMTYIEVPDIQKAISDGYTNINNATTVSEATEALVNARNNILQATKDYTLYLLGVVYNNGEVLDGKVLKPARYNMYVESINAVNSYSKINDVITNYENAERVWEEGRETIDSVRTAKNTEFENKYKTQLQTEIPGENNAKYENKITNLETIKNEAKTRIDSAKSYAEMDSIINEEYNKIVEELKTSVKAMLDKLKDNIELVQSDYNKAIKELNNDTTLEAITKTYSDAFAKATIKTSVNSANDLTSALSTNTSNDAVITLSEDIKLDNSNNKKLTISGNRNVTINLANKKITNNESSSEIVDMIKVENGASLTITGGTIEAKTTGSVSNEQNNKWAIENDGDLTLKNVKIDSDFGISSKGNLTIIGEGKEKTTIKTKETAIGALKNDSKITIKNVTIESERCAFSTNGTYSNVEVNMENVVLTQTKNDKSCVYLPASGKATFTNCTISGGSAIETKGSSVTVIGGKLEGKENQYTAAPENVKGSGSYSNGSALLIVTKTGYNNGGTIDINVSNTTEITKKAADAHEIEVYQSNKGVGVKQINIHHPSKYEVKLNNISGDCTVSTAANN